MDAELIRETLLGEKVNFCIMPVTGRKEFEQALATGNFDLILSDYRLPAFSGMEALSLVRQKDPDLPFILLSGTLGEEQAVEALKCGANDYIIKSRLQRLGFAITRAVREFEEKLNRRRADESLRQNEERLRCVLKATNDAVWDWDLHNDLIWYNQGLKLLFGYDDVAAQLTHDWWKSAVHPSDLARVLASLGAVLAGKSHTWAEEYRFRRADGRYAFVFDRGLIVRDLRGEPIRMIGAMMDMTERRAAEEQIRRQAELLEQTHDAIYVMDGQGRIGFWNAGAERLYGWRASEVLGRVADDLFYKDNSQLPQLELVYTQGEWTGELNQTTKSGGERVVISRRTQLRDSGGKPAGILNINTDITEQKKLEHQFLRAQRMECVGALAGGIAHDLNNMLAPIVMAAEMLKENVRSEDEKLVELVATSANRGAELVRQILAFARGTSKSDTIFNLGHLISDVEKVLKATLPAGIKIESKWPRKLENILGDPTQIHQVLMNLCINARDAMPNGGRLTISAGAVSGEEGAGWIWVRVEDTGMGIPEALLGKIFEPFFTTKDPGKGTGLGLATVKKIIAGHQGRIEVSSVPGSGTKFTMYLPAAVAAPTVENGREPSVPLGGHGERILVAEDEAALREILRATLESFNYQVEVASNGEEALSLLRRGNYDLVLTDLNMPVMGGLELVRQAARLHLTTRFVLMTGVVEKDSSANGGGLQLLKKPFSTHALLRTLREVLDGPGQDNSPFFEQAVLARAG